MVYWSMPMLQHNSKVGSPMELYHMISVAIIHWSQTSSKMKLSNYYHKEIACRVSLAYCIDCNASLMFKNDIFSPQTTTKSCFCNRNSPLRTSNQFSLHRQQRRHNPRLRRHLIKCELHLTCTKRNRNASGRSHLIKYEIYLKRTNHSRRRFIIFTINFNVYTLCSCVCAPFHKQCQVQAAIQMSIENEFYFHLDWVILYKYVHK